MTDYVTKPEHKFTFGLWTVGKIGRDPFGEPWALAGSGTSDLINWYMNCCWASADHV